MFSSFRKTCLAAVALGLAAPVLVTPAYAATVYQSATYTGQDTGEYILSGNDLIGAAFTITQKTKITGIGAQFGGFPGGQIFGAIVPLASQDAFPAGASTDLASIALGHVVFAVPQVVATDLVEPLSVTLAPGSYGVIFGSGQFGATGFAGLGYLNTPVGSPTLFRSFFSDGWDSFGDTGVRLFVEGNAVPEPATWGMFILGFAGIGWASRRKGRITSAATA